VQRKSGDISLNLRVIFVAYRLAVLANSCGKPPVSSTHHASAGEVRHAPGDRLVDRYLEFLADRAKPNTLRAVAGRRRPADRAAPSPSPDSAPPPETGPPTQPTSPGEPPPKTNEVKQ